MVRFPIYLLLKLLCKNKNKSIKHKNIINPGVYVHVCVCVCVCVRVRACVRVCVPGFLKLLCSQHWYTCVYTHVANNNHSSEVKLYLLIE